MLHLGKIYQPYIFPSPHFTSSYNLPAVHSSVYAPYIVLQFTSSPFILLLISSCNSPVVYSFVSLHRHTIHQKSMHPSPYIFIQFTNSPCIRLLRFPPTIHQKSIHPSPSLSSYNSPAVHSSASSAFFLQFTRSPLICLISFPENYPLRNGQKHQRPLVLQEQQTANIPENVERDGSEQRAC